MKQIWPNYSYSPTTNVLTLTGLNIDRDQLLLVTAADRGRIMYNFADSSVTASAFTSGANTALTLVATTAGLTTTAALVIYYDDQLQSTSISISNLPATQTIAGTVTANVPLSVDGYTATTGIRVIGTGIDGGLRIQGIDPNTGSSPANLEEGGKIPVFGTVTAMAGTNFRTAIEEGILDYLTNDNFPVDISSPLPAGTAQIGSVTASISGTVPVSGTFWQATQPASLASLPSLAAGTAQIGSVTASISNSVTIASLPAISGTVTANSSNGSLTTRFGSVTTANTAFATSAVTNANRKYLLIQNVTTASNVITVGVGFTPTTTQGIQLTAGAGLTFEGNYIPTGAINLLSSVTASCFIILEA